MSLTKVFLSDTLPMGPQQITCMTSSECPSPSPSRWVILVLFDRLMVIGGSEIVQESSSLQIYGDVEAPSKDCFRMFNPVDAVTFRVRDLSHGS